MAEQGKNTAFVLTPEDIKHLIKSPFETKIEVTKKIANYYKSGGFDTNQMQIAQDVFRMLVKDTEVEIRKALSEAIKDIDNMPADVIKTLANDLEEVSLPVLQFSEVLSDIDLIDIVNNTQTSTQKQLAITNRETISEPVSNALIGTGNAQVVGGLLQNKGAIVSESGYIKVMDSFSDVENIMVAVIERDKLPVAVVEQLASVVSHAFFQKLAQNQENAETYEKISHIINKSREIATMKVIGLKFSETEYLEFLRLMEQLHIAQDHIPIYALCMGNVRIFEVWVARFTKIAIPNVKTLVRDASNNGFRALYIRTNLPESLYKATELLIEVLRELEGRLKGSTIFLAPESVHLVTSRLQEKAKAIGVVENLDYILSLVEHSTWK